MFAKLLKHEWKGTGKLLGMLSLAALGVGVVGAIVLKILVVSFADGIEDGLDGFIPAILIPAMLMIVITLIAYAFGSVIILMYRFYKNKFTDEGYLTFTLPVNSHQIFLSSLLNMLIWMLIISFVIFVCIFLVLVFGTAEEGIINPKVISSMSQWPSELWDALISDWQFIQVGIISPVYTLVMVMTSITIGAVWAKKHKILAAFGIYYAIGMINGIISTVITIAVAVAQESGNAISALDEIYLTRMLGQLVMIIGGYFLSTHLMKNKLNLP